MNNYLLRVGVKASISFIKLSKQQSPQFARGFCTVSKKMLETIDQQVKSVPCVLYMKGTPDSPQCGFSNTVVRILEAEGAQYSSHNVLANSELRDGIKQYGDWPTIPQVYIKGQLVGGADILMGLYKNGELSKMLQDAGVVKQE